MNNRDIGVTRVIFSVFFTKASILDSSPLNMVNHFQDINIDLVTISSFNKKKSF